MSWSLQLRNGDLALGGTRFAHVTGAQKLVQDLRCAILEARGHDDMHPSFGSLIDGGIDEAGRYVPSLIGDDDWDRSALRVRSEINRVVAEHQKRQIARVRADRITYGESTLDPAELLVGIRDIEMTQAQDRLLVRVILDNGDGSTTTLDVPVNA